MAAGRALINPPPFTPHAYGLLGAAADVTANAPAHWEAGLTWQPLCAAAAVTFDECLVVTGAGEVAEPATKTASFDSLRRGATPFTVYARKDCSAPTYWNDAAAQTAVQAIRSDLTAAQNAVQTINGRITTIQSDIAAIKVKIGL